MPTLNEKLTQFLKSHGASLSGFADLKEIESKARDGFPYSISIAVALNPAIISGIKEGPTAAYYHEYKRVNQILDKLGQYAARFLSEQGYKAQSFAATNAGIDRRTLSTRLPHKTTATRAGLGWIGKSNLLVTKKYGSAVRLTTVLTDAPITPGRLVNDSLCGHCTDCVDACPAHVHTGFNWQLGMSREALYDAFKCHEKAREFQKLREGVHDNICGICIVACPWTKQYLERGH
jgi:epoxyqueuosine reductase